MIRRFAMDEFDGSGSGKPCLVQKALLVDAFQLHDHAFHELVLIMRGQAIHRVQGRDYPARAGDVFVLAGDVQHGFSDVHHLMLINIMFRSGLLEQMPAEMRFLPGFQALFQLDRLQVAHYGYRSRMCLAPGQLARLEPLLEAMVTESSSARPDAGPMLGHLLHILLTDLARTYEAAKPEEREPVRQMADALVYLECHLADSLSTADLARMAGFSVRHFSRLFRSVCQLPPAAYIQTRRLQRACRLLRETDWPVGQIAAQCGYQDNNYFSRIFRQHYQTTPGAWRQADRILQQRIQPVPSAADTRPEQSGILHEGPQEEQ